MVGEGCGLCNAAVVLDLRIHPHFAIFDIETVVCFKLVNLCIHILTCTPIFCCGILMRSIGVKWPLKGFCPCIYGSFLFRIAK